MKLARLMSTYGDAESLLIFSVHQSHHLFIKTHEVPSYLKYQNNIEVHSETIKSKERKIISKYAEQTVTSHHSNKYTTILQQLHIFHVNIFVLFIMFSKRRFAAQNSK